MSEVGQYLSPYFETFNLSLHVQEQIVSALSVILRMYSHKAILSPTAPVPSSRHQLRQPGFVQETCFVYRRRRTITRYFRSKSIWNFTTSKLQFKQFWNKVIIKILCNIGGLICCYVRFTVRMTTILPRKRSKSKRNSKPNMDTLGAMVSF